MKPAPIWAVALLCGTLLGSGALWLKSPRNPSGAQQRVKTARENVEPKLKSLFRAAHARYPASQLFFQIFKAEREVEVWTVPSPGKAMVLLQVYPVAAMSGSLGPKRKEGDSQVPEGIYYIDRFNPSSSYHLSLGLNYPNSSDLKRSDKVKPGSDIFIHGSNVSIGCIAMTDSLIEEIYILSLDAHNDGSKKIPVHIFPFRMTSNNCRLYGSTNPSLSAFWSELKPIYDRFTQSKKVPDVKVGSKGQYQLLGDVR